MISIVIPVYNEEAVLKHKMDYFKDLSSKADLIFVDGGSYDRTATYLKDFRRVIQSPKGRAVQMNNGAKAATTDIILFLHADTHVDVSTLGKIEQYVKEENYIGGCFKQIINAPGLLYRWIAWTGNIRAKYSKVYYGDQGIFVKKEVFDQIGGFPLTDIGEDVYFSKVLRKHGKVSIFSEPIYCSARRWTHQGVFKTYWINLRIKLGMLVNQNHKQLVNNYRDIR